MLRDFTPMHSLLKRQLHQAGFSQDTLPTDLNIWKEFVSRVERSYLNADRERERLSKNSLILEPSSVKTPDPMSQQHSSLLRFQTVIAAIQGGICVFDHFGQLVLMNPTAEHYLGAEHRQHWVILEYFEVHEKNQPQTRLTSAMIVQRLAEGQKLSDGNAILHLADQSLPVSFELDPIIENSRITGSVLLFSDISEVKKVEKELIAAKEFAEKASQAKSQFLSSMSHELRTPMNAILGYGELLKEDLNSPLEEFDKDYIDDMQQYVGNILQAGWHLLELINKVLDLSRIEAGKLEVTIAPIEFVELIKECISLISPSAEKRAITIYNETATLTPTYVLADRARLKQVLINLLSNAVKYNREEGTITMRIRQESSEYVCLEVIDTGKGFASEQKDLIFEPFTRLSGVNVIEGTGIGLTITKRLLEIMDGQIGVESEPDVGTNFWIKIPSGELFNKTESEVTNTRGKYVLLYVEDSRTNVSLIAQILKARPHIALMSAHTGEMGLELANMHHPDIILLDINLPGMDGFEVLKHLRASEQTCHIPVLALSAIDTAHNKERSREEGFLNYIVKPIDIKQFLVTIDEALERCIRKLENS
ncbi:MAG: hypothetical protein BWK79_17630 [Beggiatoa sp. IS2]|nr:MAG: hypothetical protein BWK79_17630 [Beggiatoa sp. IS2]